MDAFKIMLPMALIIGITLLGLVLVWRRY